jgi:hypothetical protein
MLSMNHAKRQRESARRGLRARFGRDRVDVRVGAGGQHVQGCGGARRRAAGHTGMHAHRGEELGEAQAQDRGETAAGRHPGEEHAPRVRAVEPARGAYLRGHDRGLALAGRGAPIEPVPAAPDVGVPRLSRQEHEPVVRVGPGRDARARSEILGRLAAAVEQHEQRATPPAGMAARNVDQIVARRPRPRRDRYPAVPRELASLLEAPRLGRRTADEPREEVADAREQRPLRLR